MLEHEAMAAIREHFNPTPHQEASMGMVVKELLKSEFDPIKSNTVETVKGAIDVLSNVDKWVSFVKDFYAIYQSGLGTVGAMASIGTVGFAFSVIGPFFQFWGFCLQLRDARSNTDEYQAIATAFTVTAWAFGDTYPITSDDWWKEKQGPLAPVAGYLDKSELNTAWLQAQGHTLVGLKQLVSKSTIASKDKMSASKAEKCLKMGMCLAGRQNLLKAVLRNLAKEARSKSKGSLATALEGAAGFYTDPSGVAHQSAGGATIKYPEKQA